MVAIFEEDIEDDESDFLAHSHKRASALSQTGRMPQSQTL